MHWTRVTQRVDNVRANRQFADEVVMSVKMEHLICLVEVYLDVKIVDVTLVVPSIRFVTKERVNVNAILE